MSRWRKFLASGRPQPPGDAVPGDGRGGDSYDRHEPWGPRLVLASGVLFGLVSLANLLATRPDVLGVNAHVYYLAGEAVLSGGELYAAAAPGFANLPYVYPPVVALVFVPYALLGSWQAAFAAHTALSIAASLLLARLLVALAERGGRRLARVDRVLVALFAVGSVHVVPSLFYGNVNPILVAALAAGVVRLGRPHAGAGQRSRRLAGAAFAVPAIVKVFPAAFGVWLVRLRDWRALGAALGTGLAAVGASFLAFGVEAHRAYITEALLPRRRTGEFVGGLPPEAPYLTIRRPLSMLFPDADPALLALLAGASLAPVAAYLLAADVEKGPGAVEEGPGGLVALHGTVAATLLFLPSYQTYFVFLFVTLVPLLYKLVPGRPRTLFVAGALVANLSVTLPGARLVLGPPLEAPVLAVLTPVLTFGSPRLYGTLLTLLACALYRLDGE